MWLASRPHDDVEEELDLPALDVGTPEEDRPDEAEGELALPAASEMDDDLDAPIDIGEPPIAPSPSASGEPDDDGDGLADPTLDDSLPLEVGEGSLLDDGSERLRADDEADGIEPMPDAGDHTDVNGLDDATGEQLVEQPLPKLDEGDDEAIDVGITLEADETTSEARAGRRDA